MDFWIPRSFLDKNRLKPNLPLTSYIKPRYETPSVSHVKSDAKLKMKSLQFFMKTKLTLGIFQGGNKEFKGEKKIYQSLKEKNLVV